MREKIEALFQEKLREWDQEIEEVTDDIGALVVGDIGDLFEWYKSRSLGLKMLRDDVLKALDEGRR